MLEQFLNHIERNSLCTNDQKILLAVSGGLDSMVMLHLFKAAGYSVGVAHCNFQLRGEESDGDEIFVKQMCEQLSVSFYTKRFDTEVYAKLNGVSIQMAARELRYAWFDELISQGFHKLATAHHFNDSIETILLGWINGGELESFSGIPVKNGRTIRPMLFAAREAVENFAKEKKFEWREDRSNSTDDYQRNFLRHQIIPKLKEINPSLESTLQRGQRKIKDEHFFLDQQLLRWKTDNLRWEGSSMLIRKEAFINATLLWLVIRVYGFNFDQCEDISRGIYGQSGKQFNGLSHQLIIDREHLIITPLQNLWEDTIIEIGQAKAVLGALHMDIEKGLLTEPFTDPTKALLDADKLKFPLCWRKWKPGDFFYPLGMDQKRKLSDFLIDKKVSVAEKNFVTVLESEGQIVWIVGYRIDNRFKIEPNTRTSLSFFVQPHFA